MALQWFDVLGQYAGALVAAEDEAAATEIIRSSPDRLMRERFLTRGGNVLMDPTECPGEPSAPGLYAWWAE